MSESTSAPRRIAIIGGGISGLAAAWALDHHPDRFDFRLYEARNRIGGNAVTADHAAARRQLHPLRHLRHRLHSVGIPAHHAVDGGVRHRADRHPIQLQREVSGRHLCPRFRLRHQGAAATRDCEVPANPRMAAPVRLADPVPVEVPERPQPVQLRQHGDGPEPGRTVRGLQVQGAEAHVRQLPDGDERVRHARGSLFAVPSSSSTSSPPRPCRPGTRGRGASTRI